MFPLPPAATRVFEPPAPAESAIRSPRGFRIDDPVPRSTDMATPGHILIVEDDYAIRETVVDVLTYQGFEVSVASNGAEALERLGKAPVPPSLILLDLMMPVMDGYQFRSAQSRDPRIADIPVVVFSAGAGPEVCLTPLAPAAYLPKPFELHRLIDVVERYAAPH